MKDDTPAFLMIAAILAVLGFRQKVTEANKTLGTAPFSLPFSPLLGAPTTTTLEALYQKHGKLKGVDWKLIKAHAIVESNENASAKNPADPSYGLMQVLCRAPCPGCQCQNRFNVAGWSNATPDRLFNPDFNLHIATQIMRWNIDTYGLPRAIAVYNAFSARFDPQDGPFRNQGYVDKVLKEWQSLGGGSGRI